MFVVGVRRGVGSGPAGPAVVNEATGDTATRDGLTGVALVRETTFQKYVVPGCKAAGGVQKYVVGGSFVIIAGTLPANVRLDCDVPT